MNRVDELARTDVFQEKPGGARLEPAEGVVVLVVRCEDEHANLGVALADARAGVDAVHDGHSHVHEHNVRERPPCLGCPIDGIHRLLAVARLTPKAQRGITAEHQGKTQAGLGLVVHDHHVNVVAHRLSASSAS